MSHLEPHKRTAILQVLHNAEGVISSSEAAHRSQSLGVKITPRTARYYLQHLAEEGLVEKGRFGRKGGCRITNAGIHEVEATEIVGRVGFMSGEIDHLAYQMDFNLRNREGYIVLNVTVVEKRYLRQTLCEMTRVFEAGLGMGQYLSIFEPGFHDERIVIPEGKVGVGTMCSVTINGILLNEGISVASRFGGNLELEDLKPKRFTELIDYSGTTLDPLEIFVKAQITNVQEAAATGNGSITASFREIPTLAIDKVQSLQEELADIGLQGMFFLGNPDQSFLEIPVAEGRTGIIAVGGLNPAAAVEETGIFTDNRTLSLLMDFSELIHYQEAIPYVKSKGLINVEDWP